MMAHSIAQILQDITVHNHLTTNIPQSTNYNHLIPQPRPQVLSSNAPTSLEEIPWWPLVMCLPDSGSQTNFRLWVGGGSGITITIYYTIKIQIKQTFPNSHAQSFSTWLPKKGENSCRHFIGDR